MPAKWSKAAGFSCIQSGRIEDPSLSQAAGSDDQSSVRYGAVCSVPPNPQFRKAPKADFDLRPDQVRMRFDQVPDHLLDIIGIEPLARRSAPFRACTKPPGDAGDRRIVRRTVGQAFDEAPQPGSHEGGGHVAGLGSVDECVHRRFPCLRRSSWRLPPFVAAACVKKTGREQSRPASLWYASPRSSPRAGRSRLRQPPATPRRGRDHFCRPIVAVPGTQMWSHSRIIAHRRPISPRDLPFFKNSAVQIISGSGSRLFYQRGFETSFFPYRGRGATLRQDQQPHPPIPRSARRRSALE
jgi:hypothetical protein